MGQYHVLVNLDRKEFVNPWSLGDGAKLMEQAGGFGGTASALVILLAVSNGRGGGDLYAYGADKDTHKIVAGTVGRWGGDRIAYVGDYAEMSDLPSGDNAHLIWDKCMHDNDDEYTDITPMVKATLAADGAIQYGHRGSGTVVRRMAGEDTSEGFYYQGVVWDGEPTNPNVGRQTVTLTKEGGA